MRGIIFAALILATPANAAPVATCLVNEGILQTVRELSLFGVDNALIDEPEVIKTFATITGFAGDVSLIKRLLFMFGRPEGSSIVFLMGQDVTCHRLGAPTAAARALYTQLMGTRV